MTIQTTEDPGTHASTLATQRRALPDQPGVYLFRDGKGRVIYVGKAKSIRKRVASHFSKAQVPSSPGHAEMVAAVAQVECVIVASEAEALLSEQGFIKQYRPRFNIPNVSRSAQSARGACPQAGHGPSASLYPQLRPRPHGLARDTIVRNQRARLCGATIEAIAANGYEATSVAELSRLAGVSKRIFYEQFANKEACFLAIHDAIVDRAITRVVAAYRSDASEAGLRCAVEAFVLAAAEAPKAARLALVETLGAGPAALAHAEAGRRRFERILAVAFGRTSAGGLPPAIVRGIAYGVEGVVRQSLLGGGREELAAAAGELADWVLAHGSPAVAELSNPALTLVNRVGCWPRVRARATTGARLLGAAAEIATCDGYARLTQLGIAGRAGVSDREFEERYESAEACYLAAIDLVVLEALTSTAAASRTAGDGPRGAYRGIAALLDNIAEDPVLRGLIVLDAATDGAPVLACRERMLRRFVDLLASRLPVSQRPPSVVAEATVHAVWGIVRRYVVGGAAHRLPELAGQATYVALAPVVGAEAAVRAILAEEHTLDADGRVDSAAV